MNKIYTGVGSRKAPLSVLQQIETIAEYLAKRGFTLRSGAATGCDSAFENGCDKARGKKEIYLPWLGFNDHPSKLLWQKNAWDIAADIHPVWDNLDVNSRCLHARNVCQVLGLDCESPSDFLICYTEDGKIQGGTATAINLALKEKIPVFNLGKKDDLDEFRSFCQNGFEIVIAKKKTTKKKKSKA